MSDIVEQGAVISGIGMSRIGRKTGIAGLDLTAESSAVAIADAGLTPADIDGIATMGDTPIPDAAAHFGIEHSWTGGGMGRWGLLSPVVEAFGAVGRGEARHVLVYRTVKMMGGSVMPAAGAAGAAGAAAADSEASAGAAEVPVTPMSPLSGWASTPVPARLSSSADR